MRLTSLSIIIAALLAVGQLAQPAQGRRRLLRSRDERTQAEREAVQLAAQQAQLAALVADGEAEHAEQADEERQKLADMASDHAVEEQQQLADQQRELADQAAADGAARSEQEQLEAAARRAERKARKAAREEKRRQAEQDAAAAAAAAEAADRQDREESDNSGGSSDDKKQSKEERRAARKAAREAEAAQAAQAQAADSDESSRGSGGSSDSSDRDADTSKDSSRDSSSESDPRRPSGSGPIWGKFHSKGGKGGKGFAYATYHYYAPGYETSSLYCADQFNKFLPVQPDHWLLEYPWTAYCNDDGLGPMNPSFCGRCLKARNPATGDTVKLRVVDMCGQGGVDIDPLGFNALVRSGHSSSSNVGREDDWVQQQQLPRRSDGNGAGVRDGHMELELEWC